MIGKLKQNKELWGLFTKQEEYNPPFLDLYQRFPLYLSKHRNILEPEVSKFLMEKGLKVEYPQNKKFTVCLTHDIDDVSQSLTSLGVLAFKALKYKKFSELRILLSKLSKKYNPWWNFEDIMSLEREYEAKSVFYFLASEDTYKIEDVAEIIGTITDKGWEVGLHGSYNAYNNLELIKKEKKNLEGVLGKKIIGYRNHCLRFKVPDTWELLSKAGFKYDTTFGYADCVGFRNGMSHPFKPFNLGTNKEIDVLEIPLTIMDCTLFDYMKLDMEGAWEITKLLIDTVEKYNGVITILWHNTYMLDDKLKFYEKILKYCHEKKAWMTSGEEIWKWWSKYTG